MKHLLLTSLLALSSLLMMAQHPQELRIKGPVSSFAERIYGGGYKFGELTQEDHPQRVDTFFLYNDARIGAIWRNEKGGNYFIDYKYNAENKLASVHNRKINEFSEYVYEGSTLKEINIYVGNERSFDAKRKYYNKKGIKSSVLYDAQGNERSFGKELYVTDKQKYSSKNYPGYVIYVSSGNNLTKKIDGAVSTSYVYNKNGYLATIKSIEGAVVTTRTFRYEYDNFGNWVKCTETKVAPDGTKSFVFYERDYTYGNTSFDYVDPVKRFDDANAREAARVKAARDKFVQDSIRAHERFVQDSILQREREVQDSLRQAEQQRAQAKQQEVEAQRKAQMAAEMAAIKSAECFRTNIINIDKNEAGDIKKLTIDANGLFYFGNYTPTTYTEKEVLNNGKYVCYKGEGTDNYIVLEYEDGKIDDAYFILDAHTVDTKINTHYEFDGAALKAIKKHFK